MQASLGDVQIVMTLFDRPAWRPGDFYGPVLVPVYPSTFSSVHCTVDGPGATSATTGVETYLWVQAQDRFSNIIDTGGAQIDLSATDGVHITYAVVDEGNGSYVVKYKAVRKAVVAPSDHIGLKLALPGSDEFIGGRPLDVELLTVSPPHCYAVGPGLENGTAGDESLLTLFCRTREGVAVDLADTAYCLKAAVTSDTSPEAETTDWIEITETETVGTYSMTFVPTLAGPAKVWLWLCTDDDRIQIPGAPWSIEILPADLDPAHCHAEGDGLKSFYPGEEAEFIVHAADRSWHGPRFALWGVRL